MFYYIIIIPIKCQKYFELYLWLHFSSSLANLLVLNWLYDVIHLKEILLSRVEIRW